MVASLETRFSWHFRRDGMGLAAETEKQRHQRRSPMREREALRDWLDWPSLFEHVHTLLSLEHDHDVSSRHPPEETAEGT